MQSESVDVAERFLGRLTAWANARRDVHGVLVIGSRARRVAPADSLSDVDIMLITTSPSSYLTTWDWLSDLGTPVLSCHFSSVVGTRPVVSADFDAGVGPLHVDFAIVTRFESFWAGALLRVLVRYPSMYGYLPTGLAAEIESWSEALARGTPLVLVDKHGSASRMFRFAPLPRAKRTANEAEWKDVVNSFLELCLWKSKLLCRGERWMATQVADRQLKDRLLKMIEWHASRTEGGQCETWYTGRFLETWADPRVVRMLPETFGRCDDDAWRALFVTMDVFSMIGRETAIDTGSTWPEHSEQRVRAWVQHRFAHRPAAR